MSYEIVIIGGGFAGAYCGQTLGKLLKGNTNARVALIAERNVLVFHPMLPEVAGSTLSPRDVVQPLREFCKHITVLQGNVTGVDWAHRTVTVDGGRFTRNQTVQFKHLVLAPGSVTDLSRVPGLSAYGWPLKTVSDALRLRAAVINRLEEANLVDDESTKRRLLTFVVVGGGFTGVETAGQVLDLVKSAVPRYGNLKHLRPRVVLIHSQAHLLPEIGDRLGDYAQKVLIEKGADVLVNAYVSEVTATRVILRDGSSIEANTVIASVGNAPSPIVTSLVAQLGLPTDKGRLKVLPTLQVEGQTELWAAGDCASIPWNDRGVLRAAPPTAQFALREGRVLGENLARVVDGRGTELKPFTYRYMGQLATVGDREAVAEMFGFHFKGFFAWWMWRTVYLAKLPGALRRLRVMIDWTLELFFPRDISVTLPPPDDLIRAIHLEKGEVLVEGGEPARAFYVVRKGAIVEKDSDAVTIGVNGVIDDQWFNATRCWKATLVAKEPTDVIVLRSHAFTLLNSGLRLIPRETSQPITPA